MSFLSTPLGLLESFLCGPAFAKLDTDACRLQLLVSGGNQGSLIFRPRQRDKTLLIRIQMIRFVADE